MIVNFVTQSGESVASYRYHNQIPAKALQSLGHEAVVTGYPIIGADAYVFSKHWNYGDHWYAMALAQLGKKMIFHCCDNHFGREHGEHYRRMMSIVDKVTVTTPYMGKVLKLQGIKQRAQVIDDPYEFDEAPAQFAPYGKLKVLWFGHPSNIGPLADIWPEIKDKCDLRICTSTTGRLGSVFEGASILPYSKPGLLFAMAWSDCVILPQTLDEITMVKSPNRLVEAVRRGKFVIASPIPSYTQFTDIMYIGDVSDGVEWILRQKNERIVEKIRKAQEYVKQKFDPAIIGKKWERILSA